MLLPILRRSPALFLLHLLSLNLASSSGSHQMWRGDHHQQIDFDSASGPDGIRYRKPFFMDTYRLHCHSCMSPYLEDQFQFISHLYRRPLVFSDKCDHGQFDWRYIATKNCSDACVMLRMNDRVGGRRRFGFMRGCLSDIIHHNRTAVRFGELARTAKSGRSICTAIRLRDLFISSDRYAFDPHDHIELCACIQPNCNSAKRSGGGPSKTLLLATLTLLALLSLHRNKNGNNDSRRTMDREKAEEEDSGQEEEGEEMKSERKGSERVIWKQEAG